MTTIERPTGAQIRARRHAAGDTLKLAAARVHVTLNTWARYERDELKISLAAWELYLLKTAADVAA